MGLLVSTQLFIILHAWVLRAGYSFQRFQFIHNHAAAFQYCVQL